MASTVGVEFTISSLWAHEADGSDNSDTGEHIQDEKHNLKYIPFPTCNETGKPLELQYGVEEGT